MQRSIWLARGAVNFVRNPRTVVFGLVLLFVAYGFSAVERQAETGNDFPLFLDAAQALLEGRSPYQAGPGLQGYVYLPFFALAVSPLTFLPEIAALWVWYAVSVALTLVSFLLARALLREAFGERHATWAVTVSLMIHARFFFGNYDMGQANVLMLFLLLWSVKLAIGGRSWRSGWPLGIAAVIKPHALIMLFPFLIRRRWGMAAGFCAAAAVAGIVVPSLLLGTGPTRRLSAEWYKRVMVPARAGILQGSAAHDQSPQAALRRLVVNEPAFDDVRVNRWSLTDEGYNRLKRILQLALALILSAAWLWRRGRDDGRLVIDVALGFIGMLVLFGYLTRPHFVALLFPGAVLALLWRTRSSALPDRRVSTPLLILSAAVIFFTTPFFVGRAIQQWTLAYSIITIATTIQLTLLIIARVRLPHEEVAGPTRLSPPMSSIDIGRKLMI
jgi:hypothetical protein